MHGGSPGFLLNPPRVHDVALLSPKAGAGVEHACVCACVGGERREGERRFVRDECQREKKRSDV
jgi:hypothetical protein